MIVRVGAPNYDSLFDKLCQSSAYRRERAELHKKELLRRQRRVLLLRISDLDDQIEIEESLDEQ